jgi:lipoprotein-anchoring transpeptidase ErfK/SrfK
MAVRLLTSLVTLAVATAAARAVLGSAPVPPWVADGEVPAPAWAQSVVARPGERDRPGDMTLFIEPNRASGRRGVTAEGASLPFFGQKRGTGCYGSWWLVGPLAWVCSDDASLSPVAASAPERMVGVDGLTSRYEFVRSENASTYSSIESAEAGEATSELDHGWAVAIVEERVTPAGRWLKTSKGLWLAASDLQPASVSHFHGEAIASGRLDFGWVMADRASVWPGPSAKERPVDSRSRLQLVHVLEESGPMLRIDDRAWMLARDLSRPVVSPPPAQVTRPGERWIDVDLAAQALVAYEGATPVFATLVSTGRGGPDAETATRTGVHRIWVKLLASDMANVERDDGTAHYSMEDVPYVQFFDDGIALHGTYWHGDFGHPRSHGCVNLAPLDSRWLFEFTGPRLPAGWVATYPTSIDEGTLVRVR